MGPSFLDTEPCFPFVGNAAPGSPFNPTPAAITASSPRRKLAQPPRSTQSRQHVAPRAWAEQQRGKRGEASADLDSTHKPSFARFLKCFLRPGSQASGACWSASPWRGGRTGGGEERGTRTAPLQKQVLRESTRGGRASLGTPGRLLQD